MKHVKKLLAVVLSAALAMAMCVSAFASTATLPKKSITITNNANGNTYTVYQVMKVKADTAASGAYEFEPVAPFDGFFNAESNTGYTIISEGANKGLIQGPEGKIFGNPNINGNGKLTDGRNVNTNSSDTAKLATALANWARNNTGDVTQTINDANAHEFDLGWYLIDETESAKETGKEKGKEDTLTGSEVASKPMLVDLTQGNATLSPKNEFVDLDKVIVETDKTDNTKKNEVESNSAQIGETIDYKITTKTPKYEANVNVNALKFVLTDTFSKGLTYDSTSLKIYKNQETTPLDSDAYTAETSKDDGKTVLNITFKKPWLKENQDVALTATYSAMLNADAVVNDMSGNPNDVKLVYSNNPGQAKDSDGDGNIEDNEIPTKELEDKVITYTYGIDIIKVDGHANTDLPGAEFELTDEKGDKVTFVKGEREVIGEDGNPVLDDNNQPKTDTVYRVATKDEIQAGGPNITTTVTSKNGGEKAIIEGLDASTYSLTETKAPDQYTVLADSIDITITEKTGKITQDVTVREYDNEGNLINTTVEKKDYVGPTGNVEYSVSSVAVVEEVREDGKTLSQDASHKTGSTSATEGSIQMNVYVPNEHGMSMPETGSRTAMYCMIGGAAIIVLGAGYYLMGARRNKKEQ